MYLYIQEMEKDVRDYIENEVNKADYADRDEMYEALYDELFCEDSVTGNGSNGGYTDTDEGARKMLFDGDGWQYFAEAIADFAIEATQIAEKLQEQDWRWFDATVRVYLLGQVLDKVLEEIWEGGEQ